MLLSRMQPNCEFYLGYGNRNPSPLWVGNEERQIEYMKQLYNSFTVGNKPQWLSMTKLEEHARLMIPSAG